MRFNPDFFYPPEYSRETLNRQRQIQLGVRICLVFVALLVVFQPLYFVFLHSLGAGLLALPALALFVALLFLLRSGQLPFALFANVLIGASLVVHTANSCTTGGPTSIFLAGYIDMQIMTALLVKRKAAYMWIALQIAVPLTLGIVDLYGVPLGYTPLDARSPQMLLVLSAAISTGAALFVILMKTSLDTALGLLQQRNEDLAIAHQHQIRAEKLAAELEQQHRLEALRQRIARDLHDDIGSTLSEINIYSSVVERQSGHSNPLLQKITTSSGKLLDAMGDIVWSINHSSQSIEELFARMREHALTVLEAQQMSVHFQVNESVPESAIPAYSRKDFYLIFKEAIHNISKHSKAQSVWVQLKASVQEGIQLQVRDDGVGFDFVQAKGNGLLNMTARAAAIGADLKVESTPDVGTRLCLTLTCEFPEAVLPESTPQSKAL